MITTVSINCFTKTDITVCSSFRWN